MKRYSDLEYLKLPKWNRFTYTVLCVICGILPGIWNFIKKIGAAIVGFCKGAVAEFVDIGLTFKEGDWKTRVSFFVMGFGSIARGQILRGVMFLLMEIVFIGYMVLTGGRWLAQLPSLGTQGPETYIDPIYDVPVTIYHDNSFKILLYGVLTIFFT